MESTRIWLGNSLRGEELKIRKKLFVLHLTFLLDLIYIPLFVCVEVLRPSQPNGVMSSEVSLPNHTFTGQA